MAGRTDLPVLAVGAAGVDMVGQLASPPQPGTSNPARIRLAYGGVARNVAENLARLGQPSNLISAVGKDFLGDRLCEELAATGVGVTRVLRVQDQPTGAYLAMINPEGRLHLALDDMRILEALTPQVLEEQEDLFEGASLVFLDGNLAPSVVRVAVRLAQRSKIPICADPTSRALALRLQPQLHNLYLITPNAAEAEILLGEPIPPEDPALAVMAARKLVAKGVHIALITLAEFGVAYATDVDHGHIPALRTQIIDPTGAGDALTAAVIFGLLNEMPLHESVRLGVSSASLTLRSHSTVASDLSLEKLYDQLVL
ncbi:MAG: carbohydrate kinase family protein [Anaerolineales bacterium]